MIKQFISLAAAAAIGTTAFGADTLAEAFSNGKVSGQFRTFYIDRDYDGGVTLHRSAIAAGGYLKYETAAYNGFSLGTALYTTNNFGIGADNLPGESLDGTLFGEDLKGYTILGEAYLKYAAATGSEVPVCVRSRTGRQHSRFREIGNPLGFQILMKSRQIGKSLVVHPGNLGPAFLKSINFLKLVNAYRSGNIGHVIFEAGGHHLIIPGWQLG